MIKRLIYILLFSLLLFGICGSSAFAEDIDEKLEGEVDEYLNEINVEDFSNFIEALDDDDLFHGMSLKKLISALTKGEITLTAEELMEIVLKRALSSFINILPSLLTIVVIAILSSIIMSLSSGFLHHQTTDIVHFVCYGLIIIIVMHRVARLISSCSKVTNSLCTLINAIFPPLITLMSAVGGSVSSSIYKPQLAFFCTIIAQIINNVIIPLFIVTVIFCIIGNLSNNIKLDKMQSAVRYLSTCIISAVFGLFITYITFAGITGGMVDTVSIKAAKFMVSSYVPILGGYLSQGFDLITASCVLIKNAVGMVGIISVLLIIIGPIIEIVAFTFGLKLVASVIQPIGDKRISDFIYSVSNCTKQLIVAIVGTGFVFMVTLLLVICTCNVGI